MSLATILEAITRRRKTQTLSSGDDYYSLIRSLANGDEVDADEAALVIEAAEKSDEDLEADVETMAKRITWAAQLRERQQLEKQRPKIEAELEKAQRELNEAIERLKPQVLAAQSKLHEIETKVLHYSTAENYLRQSCLNPSLIARENELRSAIKELREKVNPLADDHRKFTDFAVSCERQAELFHDRLHNKVSRSDHPQRIHYTQAIEKESRKASSWRDQASQNAKYLDELNAKLHPLEAELRDVLTAKLIP